MQKKVTVILDGFFGEVELPKKASLVMDLGSSASIRSPDIKKVLRGKRFVIGGTDVEIKETLEELSKKYNVYSDV